MKKIDLTQGKVTPTLLALALPIMGSSLLQFTYNLVDMFWVGHLGSGSVASVGSSSFFINLGYAMNALIVVGTGIKVSHCTGSNDQEGAMAYVQTGMKLSGLLGILFGMLLLLLGQSWLGFLGLGNAQIEQDALVYLLFHIPILFFSFFNQVFARVSASLGNSKGAFRISAAGIVTNMILDPICIYWLKGGIMGAALATLVAQILMFGLYLMSGNHLFRFKLTMKLDKQKSIEIMHLGCPVAMQRILFTLINILLAKIIAVFGAEAVAAQKIGVQIESVTYMVTGGLNGATASFIGQNYGAKKKERLQEGYRAAMKIGIIYAALSGLVFWIFPTQLARLFVKDQETIRMAAGYLGIIAYSQIFNAMEMVSTGFFTGIGRPKIPSMVSILFTGIRLPMALVLSRYIGITGIWWSVTLSTLLKGSLLTTIYLLKVKQPMNLEKEERKKK